MRWWSELTTRVRALLDRRAMEGDLDEEIEYHLDREARKLVDAGWEADDARREARRRFGGVERHREGTREAWGTRWLEDLARDAALAVRRMARAPGFTTLAVVTLGLGVGGTVALFSVVHGLLVKPLPYAEADRLRTFWMEYSWRASEFDYLADRVQAFESLAAWSINSATLRADGGSEVVVLGVATDELFGLLGTPAALGTTFTPDADRPGAERTIVLGHDLWLTRFGGDPGVVGRRVPIDGAPATVVGVMPPGFHFPSPDVEAWMPLLLDPDQSRYEGTGWLNLIGRLRPGADAAAEAGELERITAALGERFSYPEEWDKTRGAWLKPMREYQTGEVKPVLLLLMGAVGLMLLMAVANVAALLLGRSADRRGEMDLRTALGAGRGRLVRQVVTEAALLAGLAGVVGMALAVIGFDTLVAALPLRNDLGTTLTLDWPVLFGAVAVAAALGCLAAMAPARRLVSGAGTTSLRPGARSGAGGQGSTGRGGLQGALVALEVAVAVVLVTGATLFTRSVAGLYDLDTGLRIEGVGAVDLVLGDAVSPGERASLLARVEERVAALPGVMGAGRIVRLPLRDRGNQGPTPIEGRPELEESGWPNAYWRPVSLETLDVLGIELIEGRGFGPGDRAGAPEVGLINRSFAREMWPGESAVGRRVVSSFGFGWVTVVGVVDDAPLAGIRADVPRVLYRPWDQAAGSQTGATVVFRVDGGADALLGPVRAAVAEVDPRVAVYRPTTLRREVDASFAETLQIRFFLGLLAALALVVGSAGVYGVVSYAVGRRRTEYGIRMALGAERGLVVREVLLRQLVPVMVGVAVGGGVALLAARAASGLVHEIAAVDPVSLAAGAGTLLAVGAVAALVPAVRATRVDPAGTLRAE